MAGRPAVFDRTEMRKNQVVVPLNDREKSLIVEAARNADMSMAAYIRQIFKEHFKEAK